MIILDLDGCISDDQHRQHWLVNPEQIVNWDVYHSLCELDHPANVSFWYGRNDIVIMTGRPDNFALQTWQWCLRNGLRVYKVYMRPAGNKDSAVVLKKIWATELVQQGWNIQHAYDDRQDIVDMYRSLGIAATRLRAYDKEHA